MTIYKWIDRALAFGIESGIKDLYHTPKKPIITLEAKAWVINIACTIPKEMGYAAEIWSPSKLAEYSRKYGPEAEHNCLCKATKATIHRNLKEQAIQPHIIKYYLEKRDSEFEKKMKEVLCIYKEVNLQNKMMPDTSPDIITISVDEKPGVQAIDNIAPDLYPNAKKAYKQIRRDNEYKRLGTVSILAGLDIHTGKVIAQVHDRHRSCEFIQLLKEIILKWVSEINESPVVFTWKKFDFAH